MLDERRHKLHGGNLARGQSKIEGDMSVDSRKMKRHTAHPPYPTTLKLACIGMKSRREDGFIDSGTAPATHDSICHVGMYAAPNEEIPSAEHNSLRHLNSACCDKLLTSSLTEGWTEAIKCVSTRKDSAHTVPR